MAAPCVLATDTPQRVYLTLVATCRFYTWRSAFERERALYEDAALRPMMPATHAIVANADGALKARSGYVWPPCIIIERGESLEQWDKRYAGRDFITTLQVRARGSPLVPAPVAAQAFEYTPWRICCGCALSGCSLRQHGPCIACASVAASCASSVPACTPHAWPAPRSVERDACSTALAPVQVLHHVATRLQLLHLAGWAHRDIKPANILRRPAMHAWTLIDFGCAAAIGTFCLAPLFA